jgi:hypothetical protein
MHARTSFLALIALSLLAAGCAESQRPESTGKGNIRGLHAIVDGPEVVFRIEERSLGAINYKGTTSVTPFDDLSYQFNFDAALPGDTQQTRLASRSLTVVPDMDYVFVLTGSFPEGEVLLWESEERQWEGNEEVTEVAAGHLSTMFGDIDFYLVTPDAGPVSGEARGTLGFGERLDNFEVEAGEYRVVLTPAGDPSTILFRSTRQTLNPRVSMQYTVHDPDPTITGGISVRRLTESGGSSELGEVNTRPTQRFLHAASGTGNFDLYLDEDFTAPIVADVAYGEVTGDIPLPSGESAYTYTAAGNVGAVLFEEDASIVTNTRTTSFLVGPEDDLDVLSLVDDRRPVVGTSKVRLVQLSDNLDNVDIYLRPAGTDIEDVNPTFPNVASPLSSGYSRLEPGDYEITVTETGEKTPVAAVLLLDLAAGDIAEVAILDNVDPNLLDVIRYD